MKIDQVDAESRVLHVARLKSGVTDDTALTRATDIGESRFWRLDHPVDYGARNGLASHRLNPKLITQNWDDFLRVAGSLKMGKLSASELIHPCSEEASDPCWREPWANLAAFQKPCIC
jgi:hypothetical protein